jgi:hypothetical protein
MREFETSSAVLYLKGITPTQEAADQTQTTPHGSRKYIPKLL